MPTNFTDNRTCSFSDLETAMKTMKKRDTILVAIEEEGVGFHKAPLDKDGGVVIGALNYHVPTGGKMHYSKKYEEIEKKINAENSKPKLA